MPATPAAARKSVELFNRMAEIGVNDVEEAVQCVFQLRTLARQNKLDFLGRVALAEALLIAGHRDEAIEQVGAAFHTADLTNHEGMDRLSMALAHVGMRDRALSISKRLARSPDVAANPYILANAAILAVWAGDLEYLEELTGLQEAAEIEDRIASALEGYYSSAGDEGADIDAIATIVSEAPRQMGLEPTRDTGRAA